MPERQRPDGTPETKRLARRRLLKRLLLGTTLTGGSVLAYGNLVEPHRPVLTETTLTVPGLPDAFYGFRIALLSDLHVQPGFGAEYLTPALRLAREAKPDMIALLGDYVNNRDRAPTGYAEECATAASVLRAPSGVVAIFGNHDFNLPGAFEPHLNLWKHAGITPLSDTLFPLERDGQTLYFVGLRSNLLRVSALIPLMARLPKDAAKIVLWHEPGMAFEAERSGASLMLSGHTHGGQVCLPFIGPPILPGGCGPFVAGKYTVANRMPLYVTRGVGVLPPMIRINCSPEVAVVRLVAPG